MRGFRASNLYETPFLSGFLYVATSSLFTSVFAIYPYYGKLV